MAAVQLLVAQRKLTAMLKANPEFDKARKEATMELLQILGQLILEHPEQRFSQILSNYGFVKANRPASPEQRIDWQNEFYLEPVALLKRVQERVRDLKNPKG